MKQDNFLFVDLVSSIFLLVLMLGNMMGLLYITGGNFPVSLLISLFIVICYYFIVQMLKKNKEYMANNSYLVPSSLFFFVFLLFGFVSFILMSHFLNIEMNAKAQIQQEAEQKIEKVSMLGEIYSKRSDEDILNYEGELVGKLKSYKASKSNQLRNELSLEPYKIDAQVLAAPQFIDVSSLVDSKLQPYRLKIEASNKYIAEIIKGSVKYKSTFENWDRMSLSSSYKNLNKYVEDSYEKVNEKIKMLPLNNNPILLSVDNHQLPLNNPLELNKIYSPNYLIPALLVLITHLFILIPFFTHKIRVYVKPKSGSNDGDGKKNGELKTNGTIEI
ncbi:hypothetical protein [Frigoriflavimonas asaccharolytica]|uniref:Uncharacterized protein n=1 Tax=Frigoriflavimonas asaccharolytica TaxID=2735899 RepID=A0A8J8GD55_9FLAO|nr:hypothetical protein [Frigoriflavimonas asaccharolytica]NRS93577.1 hypothetical protein [Frigoriflavimonas asaccharolytica]